jgi:hypothetical protein
MQLEDMRIDVDIVMNTFLTQEDVEKTTADQLLTIMIEIKDLENDLARWAGQEQKLNRWVCCFHHSMLITSSHLALPSTARHAPLFFCLLASFAYSFLFPHTLKREIASLSMEREARAHEAAKALSVLRDIKEELKMKELVIYDYTKQAHETETRHVKIEIEKWKR